VSYSQYGLISASDFNNFVGPTTATTRGYLNSIWGVGYRNSGYGQTPISNVTNSNTVSHTEWDNFLNAFNKIAKHTGLSSTNLFTLPVAADDPPLPPDDLTPQHVITYNSLIPSKLAILYQYQNSAAAQGTTSTVATVRTTSWNDSLTFTNIIAFESADKARYFFNAGGQIALTFSHPTGSTVNQLFSELASAMGTIVISAPGISTPSTTQSINIAGTTYTGITKIGGSGTYSTPVNTGYYGLTPFYQPVYKQFAGGVLYKYLQSYASVSVKSNGTQGLHGDAGTVITIQTTFDEIPNGIVATSGTTVNCTIRYPSSSPNLTNTWGTPLVTGSVSGN
jgi:hypothetical protein